MTTYEVMLQRAVAQRGSGNRLQGVAFAARYSSGRCRCGTGGGGSPRVPLCRCAGGHVAYDYVLVDCPPSLGLLTINALTAAHSVLVPIQSEYYALEGVTALMNTISRIQHSFNKSLQLEGVVLTMFDGRTNLSLQVAAEVKRYFKSRIFTTIIPRNVRLGEAPSHGQPIHQYDARSVGAEAYRQLAKELIRRNAWKRKHEEKRTGQRLGCPAAPH